jgi:hypothetical protein
MGASAALLGKSARRNPMTRRGVVKMATLLAMGMALGKMDSLKAQGGELTVDLNQWGVIVFKHKGKTIRVPVAEVFASLAEFQQVRPA